ncbi:endospore germination permease [Paenibacillus sp. MWE-103]|uniref:Endospore germination permease n=1 Tax=Paenibacillus artemisiicola TaxID=1172618 RepID=A0ABS3W4K9_9BACL|nr:endospore germination permease [Paenibacillus artemisiicola]MBO7743111.1 endospore germination permease [Paenibacillus artemisiicola]
MIEQGKISSFQAAILLYMGVLSTSLLYLPSITAAKAHNDFWMSPIFASVLGLLLVIVIYSLAKLYPNQTFMEYLPRIIGRIPALILGLLYLISLLNMDGAIVRSYTEFLLNAFISMTPKSIIIVTIIFVCAVTVRSGLEVIGRSAQFFTPFVILSLLFIVILLQSSFDFKEIQPILANGLGPPIRGGFIVSTWFSEFFFLAFLVPYTRDASKSMKWAFISVGAVLLTMVCMNLCILFMFGEDTGNYSYPILIAARYISMSDFIENMEILIVVIWVVGLFVKISLFYYITALCAAQWIGLSDYRPIVFPLGLLIFAFAVWGIPNLPALVARSSKGTDNNDLMFRFVIPAALLAVALLRSKFSAALRGGRS